MKVASWNVNGIRACIRKGFLSSLDEMNPDIIGLQEIKASDIIDFQRPDFQVYWNPAQKKGYSGTAVLSKKKALSVQYGLGDFIADVEGRVITLEFEKLFFVTVYTPNAKRGLARLPYRVNDWDKAFLQHLNALNAQKPVVFCGDLNVAHQEIDIARPKSNRRNAGFTDEERTSFSTILNAGYIDSFREFTAEGGHYSWWSYFNNARARNIGWRLDYICLSKRLQKKLRSSRILSHVLGSDHCPVVAEFDLTL